MWLRDACDACATERLPCANSRQWEIREPYAFTGSNNAVKDDYGMLAFRDTGWTLSNVVKGQFTFTGIRYGDANLVNNVRPPVNWV